jgi:hypothetical protein
MRGLRVLAFDRDDVSLGHCTPYGKKSHTDHEDINSKKKKSRRSKRK